MLHQALGSSIYHICVVGFPGCLLERGSKSFGGEAPAARMEGGVNDLLKYFRQNHIQALKGFSFLLFTFHLFSSVLCSVSVIGAASIF